jgi:hypothetical protein
MWMKLHQNFKVLVLVVSWWCFPTQAKAETLIVGPGRTFAELRDAANHAQPGDVVEVQGDHVYLPVEWHRSGTPDKPIIIRGVEVNHKRPSLYGGNSTVDFFADNIIFENFEVHGGKNRCILHQGHQIVLRNLLVSHCPKHGILSSDRDSGSLTIEHVEVHHCGLGTQKHQIYIATDESKHPGAVFRLQFSYLHDANGGNNVKSRAERNEIYYNWIEGALYHELELIGPDGQDPNLAREDSDIVGNVLRKTNDSYATRIGGDATGDTAGRYRFVNNTFLLLAKARPPFRFFDRVESVEMYNNVVAREGGQGIRLIQDEHVRWVHQREIVVGSNNWVPENSQRIPDGWKNTFQGSNPDFVNWARFDVRPQPGGALSKRGLGTVPSNTDFPFRSPLLMALFVPPMRELGIPQPRKTATEVDLGAFSQDSRAQARPFSQQPSTAEVPRTASQRRCCACRIDNQPSWTTWPMYYLTGLLFMWRLRRTKQPSEGREQGC